MTETKVTTNETSDIVGTTDTQTLTNKTLTSPVLSDTTPTADGSIGFDRTNEDLVVGDGTNSQVVHMGEWKTWTPTWTNFTVGNATVTAKYTQIGKTVIAKLYIQLGSTSAVTGSVEVSVPVALGTALGTSGRNPIGYSLFYDSSGAFASGQVTIANTAANVRCTYVESSAAGSPATFKVMTATAPWTWATGDELYLQVTYEAE